MSIKKGAFCAKKCIIKKNLSINNFSLYNLDKYYGRTGKATGERWRYVTDNYRKTETEGNRYIGERTVLYAGGTAVGVKSGGRSHYIGSDVQGSVKNTTSDEGYVENEYSYDIFGTVISGSFTNGVDFAYCGKIYDPVTGNLNYGFRDYSPSISRFTTVDPVRDGTNWFAYCAGDSVNYVDLWGLTASESTINGSLGDKGTVYFIYNYSSEWNNNQEYQIEERKTINNEIDYLIKQEFKVYVLDGQNGNKAGTKENIICAFENPDTVAIIISGHGYKTGGIATYDSDRLIPEEVKYLTKSPYLELVIFENCYQKGSKKGLSDNLDKWQAAIGPDVTILGWEDETYVSETKSFNRLGLFDRQYKNLKYYLKKLNGKNRD